MKSTILLLSCLLILILCSCQREIEDISAQQHNTSGSCQLTKAYYNLWGSVDSTRYEYAANKISKIYYDGGYITYTYNGDKVSRSVIVDTTYGSTSSNREDYFYNSSNQLSLLKEYETTTAGVTYYYDSIALSYAGSKLIRVQDYYRNPSTGIFNISDDVTYSYTNNNISKVVLLKYPLGGGPLQSTDSTLFEYDNKPNYFRKAFTQPLILEPMFIDRDYDSWALALSENNGIKSTPTDPTSVNETYDYALDAKNNLATFKIDGVPAIQYTYNCK